jgi:hypothetical protein
MRHSGGHFALPQRIDDHIMLRKEANSQKGGLFSLGDLFNTLVDVFASVSEVWNMDVFGHRTVRWIVWAVILLSAWLFALCSDNPQQRARVWVLKEGEITEYNPSNWSTVNTIKVPKEFFRDQDRLQITRTGEMLFSLDPSIQSGDPGRHFNPNQIWVWNGRSASILNRVSGEKPAGDSNPDNRRWISLCADGRRLIWFENDSRESRDPQGLPVSVLTTSRVWHTDLSGANPVQIADFSFPRCKCATGACSETCPEARFWFPRTGVDDFFFVNHWIPGQLGSTFLSSFLFQKSGDKWVSTKLAGTFEDVLDAAQGGRIAVHTIGDGGCCGWDNAGDDQTLVFTGGKNIAIFDERRKYNNPDYDVSYYTAHAALSPSGSIVAVTIVSTAKPGEEIRLADSGKENPMELDRMRKSLETMPVTEVISLTNPPKSLLSFPHSEFAGWLSNHELLMVENGVLTAVDTAGGARASSPVKVGDFSAVYVR